MDFEWKALTARDFSSGIPPECRVTMTLVELIEMATTVYANGVRVGAEEQKKAYDKASK